LRTKSHARALVILSSDYQIHQKTEKNTLSDETRALRELLLITPVCELAIQISFCLFCLFFLHKVWSIVLLIFRFIQH
jgi:hypothetical protein